MRVSKVLLGLAAVVGLPLGASAQGWPDKPIKMIVPVARPSSSSPRCAKLPTPPDE